MDLFTQMLQSFGFPIACVVVMGIFINKMWVSQETKQKEEVQQILTNSKEREDRFYQQIEKFNITLDNFNTTLTKVDTRLEIIEKKIN